MVKNPARDMVNEKDPETLSTMTFNSQRGGRIPTVQAPQL